MKNKYLILSLIILLVLSLTGCSGINNSNNDDSKMVERVNSEIDYLDEQILGMMNRLNNIYFQKYSVSAEKITSNSATSSNKEGQQSSSEGEGESGSSGGSGSSDSSSGESSQGSSESSSGGSNGQSGGDSGGQSGNNSNATKYTMKPNTILSRKDTIDWENFNIDIENLYDSWPSIMLDLYKKEVDNKLVTDFSSDLEIALNSIKSKDKNACLVSLAKLYNYIPQFSSTVNGNNIKTNTLKTKSNLLNAYSMVEMDRWQQISEELTKVEQDYIPILNDITSNKKKEYNINKAYILIKELQKNVADKNKDTFYINYKNLLQELEIVSG